MEIKRIYSNTTPLCFLPSGKLVCYKYGSIIILDNDKIVDQISIFDCLKERFLGKVRLIFRLLRLGVRAAIAINDHLILLSVRNYIYELNILTRELSNGHYIGSGIRPLTFTIINNIHNFSNGVYFGGYLQNFNKEEVSIYKRIGRDKWKIVYAFHNGEINHIHNIIPDPFRNCVWILTGDFDSAAAIWKTADNFKTINRVLSGSQDYRACVAFAEPEGLIYATDTPFSQNYIYRVSDNNNVQKLHKIAGSCIYGCKYADNLVFATTVEPDGRNQTTLSLLFDHRVGTAILDRYSHLYIGNVSTGFKELLKIKKDFYPFIFQFGTMKFPSGINNSNKLYFQPVGLKKDDLSLLMVKI